MVVVDVRRACEGLRTVGTEVLHIQLFHNAETIHIIWVCWRTFYFIVINEFMSIS